ncbi:N-acetylmuramoyl-L-alanine amidase [Mesobacillus subterraneus]|nr:N-acetylmuramoyl-L-alanine amidase [Mesobacillus subterraneus]
MNSKLSLAVMLLFILLVSGCSGKIAEEAATKVKVDTDKPRIDLTVPQLPVIKDFMPNMNFVPRSETPTHIVLHFISNAAVNPEDPFLYEEIRNIFIEYDVAPHYMIDRQGQIYYLMPETRRARHAGKGGLFDFPDYNDRLNNHSIGIELMAVGTEEEMLTMLTAEQYQKISTEHFGYTDEQYKALNQLLDDILSRNKQIKKDRKHIIGHNEYAPDRKVDPGILFDWSEIKF